MKRYLPYLIAGIAFLLAYMLLSPPPAQVILVASRDLRAGHVLAENDLALQELPQEAIPEDAFEDTALLVDQALAVDRSQGDVIRAAHLGEAITIKAGERAVAISVDDASGLAGLVNPGNKVGVTATVFAQGGVQEGAFSKVTIEGLRVLYLSPTFEAEDPSANDPAEEGSFGVVNERRDQGVVVLAVPVDYQTVVYDFSIRDAPAEIRQVNAIELLSALESADNAHLSLYLMPRDNPLPVTSSGLWLPDLVITPQPTPTPTPTPFGFQAPEEPAQPESGETPMPTPTPGG